MDFKKWIVLSIAVLVGLGTIASCAGLFDTLGDDEDIPTTVGFAIPATMYNTGGGTLSFKVAYPLTNNETGPAYTRMKEFVTIGRDIVSAIDNILTTVGQNKRAFMKSKGSVVTLDNGKWFFFNDQSGSGYYLYFGDTVSKTNFYIDWERVDVGEFKGKTEFYNQNVGDVTKALVYYDNSISVPYIDVYVKYTNDAEYSAFRVKLEKIGTGEVTALAKSVKSDTNVWPSGWDMVGYGRTSSTGGGKGWAYGSTNVWGGIATNYIYTEYFNGSGGFVWKMGTCDWYSNGVQVLTNSPDPNHSGTNGIVPTGVSNTIHNLSVLDSAAYPSVSLP